MLLYLLQTCCWINCFLDLEGKSKKIKKLIKCFIFQINPNSDEVHAVIERLILTEVLWFSWHYWGHVQTGQLTYSHCFWAGLDLLSSKPILSAHTFTANDKCPIWISNSMKMAIEIISWPISLWSGRGSNYRPLGQITNLTRYCTNGPASKVERIWFQHVCFKMHTSIWCSFFFFYYNYIPVSWSVSKWISYVSFITWHNMYLLLRLSPPDTEWYSKHKIS